jgi:hypothetical protein
MVGADDPRDIGKMTIQDTPERLKLRQPEPVSNQVMTLEV